MRYLGADLPDIMHQEKYRASSGRTQWHAGNDRAYYLPKHSLIHCLVMGISLDRRFDRVFAIYQIIPKSALEMVEDDSDGLPKNL